MNKYFLLLFFVIFLYNNNASGQDDPNIQLNKVIPASPEAASLGKFGDVPVSYFTGQANVNIPLIEYGSGNLKGTVSLSYSPGGIKVEEVASWVGLGWALNAGGMITRTIRGIADEATNGYFTADMKAKFMSEHYQDSAYHADIIYRHQQAALGLYDLEPDIFIFNFGNQSGKFYYNQETEQFYTLTRSTLKISYDAVNNEFTIQAQDGNKYYFAERETTETNSTTCNGNASGSYSASTTSWLLTKIENSNQTEQILLEYNNIASYSFNTLQTTVKYQPVAMSTAELGPVMSDQNCITNITINSKKLSAISWKNGYLLFKAVNDRSDLPGEKSLDSIRLYDADGNNIKNFVFKYGDSLYTSRLRLDSLYEVTDSNSIKSPYKFEYEGGSLPSRLSYAQDYWGYYNGATGNTNLIPRILTWNGTQPWIVSGADRVPVLGYTKTGTLNKINYPTGGYTEFTYESNKVNNSLVPPEHTMHFEHLEGDHNGGQQTYYETEFTIDVPPNFYNGFHSGGGVYARFSFEEIGCTYENYAANDSAVLAVTGLSSGTTGATITNPNVAIYFPNGTYRLSASFNQGNNPGFEDFYFQMSWEVPDLTNLLGGGIRIQKIVDYDGINHANDKVRRFEYLNEDSTCSGYFISDWDGIFHTEFQTMYKDGYVGEVINVYDRYNSASNYPLTSDHGSYVVYVRVTEFDGENGENGKTVYTYNSQNDFVSQFPYYTVSNEWCRGQLLTQTQYENKDQLFNPVTQSINTYQSSNNNDSLTNNIAIGIKQGANKSYVGGDGLTQEELELWTIPAFQYYETVTGWTKQTSSNTITNIVAQDSGLAVNAVFGYNDLNYNQNLSVKTDSKGDSIKTTTTYPVDYTGTLPSWLQNLKDNNLLSAPIEKTVIKKLPDSLDYIISAVLMIYADTQPLPHKVYSLELNEPLLLSSFTPAYISEGDLVKDSRYKEKVSFNKYDDIYNILEQQKTNDIKQSYIWDYIKSYPTAEVKNALSTEIAYSSFETTSTGNWSFSGPTSSDASSPTGSKCYSLSGGSITKSGLTSGNYIVSYWSKNGSYSVNSTSPSLTGKTIDGWTYYEHQITGTSISISGSGYIDEVRLYPKGALMTTYCYLPLIGLSSACDANNNIIYYEYDSLNRLCLIRDQDKKIIKKIEYKYQVNYQQ